MEKKARRYCEGIDYCGRKKIHPTKGMSAPQPAEAKSNPATELPHYPLKHIPTCRNPLKGCIKGRDILSPIAFPEKNLVGEKIKRYIKGDIFRGVGILKTDLGSIGCKNLGTYSSPIFMKHSGLLSGLIRCVVIGG